jgi:hypothetical protein
MGGDEDCPFKKGESVLPTRTLKYDFLMIVVSIVRV